MKLQPDCIRAILLEIQKLPYEKDLSFDELTNALPKFSQDTLAYTCLKLDEANFITIRKINADNKTIIFSIDDMTYEGHQFLASIESDNVWAKTKSVLSSIGVTSLSAIYQISQQVVTQIILNNLK